MFFLDRIVDPFNKRPGYTFRDFIQGADNLCTKCNNYAHRDNYDRNLKICDNCGILASLRDQLDRAVRK